MSVPTIGEIITFLSSSRHTTWSGDRLESARGALQQRGIPEELLLGGWSREGLNSEPSGLVDVVNPCRIVMQQFPHDWTGQSTEGFLCIFARMDRNRCGSG